MFYSLLPQRFKVLLPTPKVPVTPLEGILPNHAGGVVALDWHWRMPCPKVHGTPLEDALGMGRDSLGDSFGAV